MGLSSSTRERRLWVLTLIVVATIYSTLALARTLAGALRERGIVEITFAAGFVLLVAGIVVQALRTKPSRPEIGVVMGIVAVYVMVLARMGTPEERTHIFEYSVVALLIYLALTERRSNGRSAPAPALIAVVATGVIGWLDEIIQGFLPNRVYDIRDVGFNALAGLLAIIATVTLTWVRQRARPSG